MEDDIGIGMTTIYKMVTTIGRGRALMYKVITKRTTMYKLVVILGEMKVKM